MYLMSFGFLVGVSRSALRELRKTVPSGRTCKRAWRRTRRDLMASKASQEYHSVTLPDRKRLTGKISPSQRLDRKRERDQRHTLDPTDRPQHSLHHPLRTPTQLERRNLCLLQRLADTFFLDWTQSRKVTSGPNRSPTPNMSVPRRPSSPTPLSHRLSSSAIVTLLLHKSLYRKLSPSPNCTPLTPPS